MLRVNSLWLLGMLLTCLIAAQPCAAKEIVQWPGLRDGTVYIRMKAGEEVTVSSKDIWAAEGSQDRLYFQAPTGEMLKKIRLLPEAPANGKKIMLQASRGQGDYRFEIVGLSHRDASLSFDADTASVFQPARVHFSITNPGPGSKLFFTVPPAAAQGFRFSARAELNGCNSYTLISPSNRRYDLQPANLHYSVKEHSGLSFSGNTYESGVWTLVLNQAGKAAFWLDNIPNFFARRPDQLFVPILEEGHATVNITPKVIGKTPLMGVAVEAHVLTKHYEDTLKTLNPEFIHYYYFPSKKDQPSMPQRATVAPFPCREEYVLISPLDGNAMLADSELEKGLKAILARNPARSRDGKTGTADEKNTPKLYISFFDEPNLRYSLENYEQRLASLLAVQARTAGAETLPVVVPESAMFMDGPTLADNVKQKGGDWAKDLYEKGLIKMTAVPPLVAWHEWVHRDLNSTDYYTDVVNYAADLFNNINPAPLLAITQTNISSGSDTSTYDQDSFYASLWLASAFARAAAPGKLHAFGWFMFTDELPKHQKGLFALSQAQRIEDITLIPKPVYYAFKMMLDNKLGNVVQTSGGHGDLAILATTDDSGAHMSLLIANAANRTVKTSFTLPQGTATSGVEAEILTLQEGDTTARRKKLTSLTDVSISPCSVNILTATVAAPGAAPKNN